MNKLERFGSGQWSAVPLLFLMLAASLAACASLRPAAEPGESEPIPGTPRAGDPTDSETHVTYCQRYADQMAGRELQREYDSMEGRFRGGESQVFRDFAAMDAQKNYRRIYENCIRDRTTEQKGEAKPK